MEARDVLYCTQCGFGQVLYINLPPSLVRSLAAVLYVLHKRHDDNSRRWTSASCRNCSLSLSLSLVSFMWSSLPCDVSCPCSFSSSLYTFLNANKNIKKKTSARVCLDRANGMSLDTKNHHQQQQQELHCCCRLCKLILWGRFTRG